MMGKDVQLPNLLFWVKFLFPLLAVLSLLLVNNGKTAEIEKMNLTQNIGLVIAHVH